MPNSRGLHGSAFEEIINFTNARYRQHGLAVVQKIPTPITPIDVNNRERTITRAFFERKSTVDYLGAAQGYALCFEAKETAQQRFPLKNIHEHQLQFMADFCAQKGIAFFLLHFKPAGEVFFLPYAWVKQRWDAARAGGRKSIAYTECKGMPRVDHADGYPIHYLEAVDRYIKESAEQSASGS